MTTATTTAKTAKRSTTAKTGIATAAQCNKWAQALEAASRQELASAGAVRDAVIEGRALKGVSADKYRELVKTAFAHLPKRQAASRVSEAMAVLKAPSLPKDTGTSLQALAKAVRALPDYQKAFAKPSGKKGNGSTASSAVKKIDTAPSGKPSDDVKPLSCAEVKAALKGTLEGMRKRAGDKEALELIAALADILE